MPKGPKIVVIGGGTGSFMILSGLKNHTDNITALVNMADDGGSTGQLRDEYGVLPPGDVRQCLVALSQAPQSVRDLFNFRFPGDKTLAGHSFGNLFLSALEMMTDNFGQAVKTAANVLNIKGTVCPITLEKCELVMETSDLKIIGESAINRQVINEHSKPQLYLSPTSAINPEATRAILDADLVVIAPGNLYGSIIPALLAEGLTESLKQTEAPILYICNLVNKPNHTRNFDVDEYVSELERFIGEGSVDIVLYNADIPSGDLLSKYALEGEYPVLIDESKLAKARYKAIAGNFLSHKEFTQDIDDILERSLIRHDSDEVSRSIIAVLHNQV
jgi:uncharacterized cofD-like protein